MRPRLIRARRVILLTVSTESRATVVQALFDCGTYYLISRDSGSAFWRHVPEFCSEVPRMKQPYSLGYICDSPFLPQLAESQMLRKPKVESTDHPNFSVPRYLRGEFSVS